MYLLISHAMSAKILRWLLLNAYKIVQWDQPNVTFTETKHHAFTFEYQRLYSVLMFLFGEMYVFITVVKTTIYIRHSFCMPPKLICVWDQLLLEGINGQFSAIYGSVCAFAAIDINI